MRTADQVKRKLHELQQSKKRLEEYAGDSPDAAKGERIARLDDQILLLEWVLNEADGAYHA